MHNNNNNANNVICIMHYTCVSCITKYEGICYVLRIEYIVPCDLWITWDVDVFEEFHGFKNRLEINHNFQTI